MTIDEMYNEITSTFEDKEDLKELISMLQSVVDAIEEDEDFENR